MSDFPNNLDPERNLASTYQEVLKHKKHLAELLPFIEILKNTFMGGGGTGPDIGTGDVIIDENGDARVPGMTVVINNTYIQQPPNDYKNDVTYEIKDKETIDLPTTDGTGTVNKYVTVMTTHVHNTQTIVNPDGSTSQVNYPAWQLAYGDEGGRLYMYYRTANDDNTWGPWKKVFDLEVMLEQNPVVVEKFSHRQVKESTVLPVEQEMNDYWFWPIEKGVDPIESAPGITDITDIPIPDIPDGYFFQSLDDPYEKYPCPTDGTDAFVFADPDTGNLIIPGEGDYDVIPGVDEPKPGYVGYYFINMDNPADILYLDDEEKKNIKLRIIGPLLLDDDNKPIDPLDPDNDGIFTGFDPENRPEVEDGGGTGTPDPTKGSMMCVCGEPGCICKHYPQDPDGQKPGEFVDQDVADDIDIIDIETGEPIDHIFSRTDKYWLLDPENPANDIRLSYSEYKRLMTLQLPGGTVMDPTRSQDCNLTDLNT